MKWICLAASVVFAVQVQAATDAGAKAAPKTSAKAKADAGVAPAKTDAGVASPKTDAGTAAPRADGGSPSAADAGAAKPSVDAGARPSVDAGAAKEPVAAPAKAGAAYTLVAVPTPDKKIERLWKSKCGSCHGADGKAATEKGKKMKMSDLSAAAWQTAHGNDEVKKSLTDGIKRTKDGVEQEMDAYGPELTPEQIGELLTYVRWLGAPH